MIADLDFAQIGAAVVTAPVHERAAYPQADGLRAVVDEEKTVEVL